MFMCILHFFLQHLFTVVTDLLFLLGQCYYLFVQLSLGWKLT